MSEYLTDEEQVERLKRLTKTYGGSALTGILLALIAYFGWSYWHKSQQANSFVLANDYQTVLDASQKLNSETVAPADKTKFLSGASALVKSHPDTAYAYQTLLLEAKVAADREDYAAAEKALTQAVAQKIEDQGLIQLAYLRLSRVQAQLGKTDAALASLGKVSDAAFAPSMNEQKGDVLLQKNDIKGAQQAYQAAWDVLAKRQEPSQLLKVKMESVGMTVQAIELPKVIKDEAAL